MNFEELTATLSKGSATAVTTLESIVAELNALKEYRICGSRTRTGARHHRIEPTTTNPGNGACPAFAARLQIPVEKALRAEIDKNLKTPRVIFVCGSSGDGKSELFRRIHASYAKRVRFHLDATHSFDPQKDGIQTLDVQQTARVRFTAVQQQWLDAIKDPSPAASPGPVKTSPKSRSISSAA